MMFKNVGICSILLSLQLIAAEVPKEILSAKTYNDMMALHGVVRLEATPQSQLGMIRDVIFLQHSWFIIDWVQNKVFQFSEKGSFIRVVGNRGNGPGEYQTPVSIERVYDGNFAIADAAGNSILVFNTNGEHLRTISYKQGVMPPRPPFIWKKPNRLYLGDLPSASSKKPYCGITDDKLQLQTLFGTRPFGDGEGPKFALSCFMQVDKTIWVGSPYDGAFEIYNLDGKLLKRVETTHPDSPTPEDFTGLHSKADRAEIDKLKRKNRTRAMAYVGDYVLVYMNDLDIYHKDGVLLKRGLKSKGVMQPLDTLGSFVVGRLPEADLLAHYQALHPNLPEKLKAVGWTEANAKNENPYLRIDLLKPVSDGENIGSY